MCVGVYSLSNCMQWGGLETGITVPFERTSVKNVRLESITDNAFVDVAAKEAFADALRSELYTAHSFKEGDDLLLRYRFTQFGSGSRFQRWMTNGFGNGGEGKAAVEVEFF